VEVLIAVDRVDIMAPRGHEAGDGKMNGRADDGATKKEEPPPNNVDLGQDDAGGYQEDDVLDG
jgi:hypothetical protein